MTPAQLIRRKRDGEELPPAELADFLHAYLVGRVPDYQMAAFLMAVFFQGLTPIELSTLVNAMLHSGQVLELAGVPGMKVDKHSTGGVGDKVSMVLAPLVAALGVPVPMVSGRNLGHTGGTIDKLESIPGFQTELSLAQFRAQLKEIGCALIVQTAEIAPLDGRLYGLRDVTGTVASVPLIAASIMSKKLAEGIDALVIDLKRGNGAFLPDEARATQLARTMIGIGERHGTRVVALATAMDRPLGRAVGNALEVAEAVQVLRGEGPADVREVTLALAAEMLVLGKVAEDLEAGRARAAAALDEGRALEMFRRVVQTQGGDGRVVDRPREILPAAPVQLPVPAARAGWVGVIDTRGVGEAAVALGAGRATLDSPIDPAVGFHVLARPGDAVTADEALAVVFARDEAAAQVAVAALRKAMPVVEEPAPPPLPLIVGRITADGAPAHS